MKRLLKTLTVLTLCLLTFSACTNNDEPEYTPSAPSFYVFSVNLVAQGTDQQDVVETTLTYTDEDGVTHDMIMDAETFSFRSAPHKTFPSTNRIVVTQRLKTGFTGTNQSYNLGLRVSVSTTSANTDGQMIDSEDRVTNETSEVMANNLNRYFPRTQTYIITADAEGQLEIQ